MTSNFIKTGVEITKSHYAECPIIWLNFHTMIPCRIRFNLIDFMVYLVKLNSFFLNWREKYKRDEWTKIWGRITCVKTACNGNNLTQQEAKRGFKLLFLPEVTHCNGVFPSRFFFFVSFLTSFDKILSSFFMTRKINIFAVTQKGYCRFNKIFLYFFIIDSHHFLFPFFTKETNKKLFLFTLLLRNQFCPCQFPLFLISLDLLGYSLHHEQKFLFNDNKIQEMIFRFFDFFWTKFML